ncbi:hypothetical protein ACJA29_03370 [Metamycoplasma sualvi]|uniref:hypothetical protein n=1 Tax=Metamycoplasma sualvi TaxID=2125 RepID=UPI0038732752
MSIPKILYFWSLLQKVSPSIILSTYTSIEYVETSEQDEEIKNNDEIENEQKNKAILCFIFWS